MKLVSNREGGKPIRDLNTENKLRVDRGRWVGGWAKWVMGIKEGTCVEHWVLYGSDESLNSTPETSITVYVSELECK